MPRLDRLAQISCNTLLALPVRVNDTAPMKPGARGDEIARWFWGEAAAGRLLCRVRDRLRASDDPRWKTAAFGVAR